MAFRLPVRQQKKAKSRNLLMTLFFQEPASSGSGRAIRDVLSSFEGLSLYERFEKTVVVILTMLINAVVAVATWHLAEQVFKLVLSDEVQPTNHKVFQSVFGMIFTVIIALEFKHSLLVVLAGQESIVRVRSIILIAMVRKFIILDLGTEHTMEIFGLSAAILSLGIVYWIVRDQNRRTERDGA